MWSGPQKWSMKNFAIDAGASRNICENRSYFDGEPVPSLGAYVEMVVMMNKPRMLSILSIDMNPNISGLQPNL